jgi:hypothetical protein
VAESIHQRNWGQEEQVKRSKSKEQVKRQVKRQSANGKAKAKAKAKARTAMIHDSRLRVFALRFAF